MSKPVRWQDAKTSPLADILRIAAELPYRRQRPPMTTEDALRQVAATGSDDAKRLARAELRRRSR